jgi:hypothetical protein
MSKTNLNFIFYQRFHSLNSTPVKNLGGIKMDFHSYFKFQWFDQFFRGDGERWFDQWNLKVGLHACAQIPHNLVDLKGR